MVSNCADLTLSIFLGHALNPARPRKTQPPQPNYRPGPAAAISTGPVASNTSRTGPARPSVTQPRGVFDRRHTPKKKKKKKKFICHEQ